MKSINLFFLGLLLISCNSRNGIIETRHQNHLYIINKSFEKSYRFTIKKTEIKEGKWYSYSTDFIELAPGEERFLGQLIDSTPVIFPVIKKKVIQVFKPLSKKERDSIENANKNNRFVLTEKDMKDIPMRAVWDTIINGEGYKYYFEEIEEEDSSHPINPIHFQYQFEVVGQSKLINKNN